MDQNPLITSARLTIRPYTDADINRLHAILSDPPTMSFWPSPFTMEQTLRWLERGIFACDQNGFGRWAVELTETGELIGDAGLLKLEIDGILENDLGYIIHARHWGKGYGLEAASACLRYGLDKLGLERVCANMPADHIASRKVAERLGMKLEKQFANVRNRNILTCLYAMQR